jgi:hypothetical protein
MDGKSPPLNRTGFRRDFTTTAHRPRSQQSNGPDCGTSPNSRGAAVTSAWAEQPNEIVDYFLINFPEPLISCLTCGFPLKVSDPLPLILTSSMSLTSTLAVPLPDM